MFVTTVTRNNTEMAIVQSDETFIHDVQSALDLVVTIFFDQGCNRVIIDRKAFSDDFFRLGTGLAGDILQKFVNYKIKLAIVGDFSDFTSKPLKDFMYESNKGNHLFFVPSTEEAVRKLGG